MKASTIKRVERLERLVSVRDMLDLDRPASEVEPKRLETRFMDGVFTGTIEIGEGLPVHIERTLTLSRDVDGTYLAYSGEHTGSVNVTDPLACEALDAVFELAANPDRVGSVTIGEPEDDAANG